MMYDARSLINASAIIKVKRKFAMERHQYQMSKQSLLTFNFRRYKGTLVFQEIKAEKKNRKCTQTNLMAIRSNEFIVKDRYSYQ